MQNLTQKKRSMTIEQRPVEIKLKGRDGHKDYLKKMLINRLQKKFPQADDQTNQIIISEVNIFLNNEYVTKESMKKLDQKVARRLNPRDSADIGEVHKR